MHKLSVYILGSALVLGLALASSHAASRAYWDQATQKWVKYDGKKVAARKVGGARPYTPIVRQVVDYDGPYTAPTIVVNTAERRLYYVFVPGKALKYGIGVGREGFQWAGTDTISRKAEWPGWTPPPQMIARERKKGRILPSFMEGGPKNPLGARALYVGDTMYRIHGSNEPWTIGFAVSSGCIRLTNSDVIDLYNRVAVGTPVVVLSGNEPTARALIAATPSLPGSYDLTAASAPVKAPATLMAETPDSRAAAAKLATVTEGRVKDDLANATALGSSTYGSSEESENAAPDDTVGSIEPEEAPAVPMTEAGLDQTAVR